jgi:lipoprotein Spr
MLLASCANMKPLAFANSRQSATVATGETNSKEVKFLDNISSDIPVKTDNKDTPGARISPEEKNKTEKFEDIHHDAPITSDRTVSIEKANSLQFKYALLLNTDVERVQDIPLYASIDEWYGTRYRMGGTTKAGVDCSAFVQSVFSSAFGASLPRTAYEQYKATQRISRTALEEGDLLFFNTRGGVSHVGIYLQNNKFVHASSSGGVMISDMFEPYYVRHFIAAGRVTKDASVSLRP